MSHADRKYSQSSLERGLLEAGGQGEEDRVVLAPAAWFRGVLWGWKCGSYKCRGLMEVLHSNLKTLDPHL